MAVNAKPGCCEEASMFAPPGAYLPCNQPAKYNVKNRDPQTYRMCEMCADHNVRNRGAKIIGEFHDDKV